MLENLHHCAAFMLLAALILLALVSLDVFQGKLQCQPILGKLRRSGVATGSKNCNLTVPYTSTYAASNKSKPLP